MEVEIQALQAGEERRGSSASQSNGCCFDQADDEKTRNEPYEKDAVDPTVDFDQCQDANVGSGGLGNLITRRNRAQERETSRTASKRKAGEDGRGGTPVKEDGEQGNFGTKKKRVKNSQGKDPRTCKENSQARDRSTLEINSLGEDPRTCKENSQARTVAPLK